MFLFIVEKMTSIDYKNVILSELETLHTQAKINKDRFRAQAYDKVIKQINALPHVYSFNDLKNVTGIGERIRAKITEIFATGHLQAAEEAKKELFVYEPFLKIHKVGSDKAKEIVDTYKITTIDQLRKSPWILNASQQLGLKYYEDFLLKIPREEMDIHARFIYNMSSVTDKNLKSIVVGSYRREEKMTGDIDILVCLRRQSQQCEKIAIFTSFINNLKSAGYILDTLEQGEKRFLGVCHLSGGKFRRIDLLMTTPEEYPYALLYFTGDRQFNIEMRKRAIELGYSLSEYGLSGAVSAGISTEREIFTLLGLKYVEPRYRTGSAIVQVSLNEIRVNQIYEETIERMIIQKCTE